MTDTIDISRHRAARETAKQEAEDQAKLKAGAEEAKGVISSAMDSMMSPAFIAFVNHAEAVLPPHSVIKAPWFQSNVSSLASVFIGEVRPDDIKTYFNHLIDWMYESYIAQMGSPPEYPPVLCESCAADPEHGPKGA